MGDGDIYEGECTPNGLNGFGRRLYGNLCQIGYFKNDQLHGNSRQFLDGKLDKSGWFEYGEFKGKFNHESEEYPYWEILKYFEFHQFDELYETEQKNNKGIPNTRV